VLASGRPRVKLTTIAELLAIAEREQ